MRAKVAGRRTRYSSASRSSIIESRSPSAVEDPLALRRASWRERRRDQLRYTQPA